MLMVPTELRSSPIHGVGIFLLAPVKKGELIWRFDSRIDKVYSLNEIKSLPPLLQKFIGVYAAWHKPTGLWVLYNDNAKYINHAAPAVTTCLEPALGDLIASADLAANTELTVDYYTICDMTRTTGQFSETF